jgi:hypothetical protein
MAAIDAARLKLVNESDRRPPEKPRLGAFQFDNPMTSNIVGGEVVKR